MSLLRTVLWGPHVLLLILAAGVWFTLRSRFMQLRRLPRMAADALRGRETGGERISAFQALTASLAGSLGTGNIIGVAAALTAGGPGAIVWMWISAFFGMMTVYAENVLAAKFSSADAPGAVGYIRRALGKHTAQIYAAGCVLSALGMGTMAQTGAVSAALETIRVPPWLSGVLAAALLVLCVRGGLQKAVRVTEKLVPFMAGLFLLACGAVLVLRYDRIPAAVSGMLRAAFTWRAGAGGAVGMLTAMRVGVSRGVFTNEAGLGSGTFALSRAADKTPEQIGTLGALQVFIDTIVLCTITALCLLVSPAQGDGAAQTLASFSAVLGNVGRAAVSVSMALFAFATVVAWSCYGMEALHSLAPEAGRAGRNIYVAFAALSCFLGCIMPFSGVLSFCDAFNGVMALSNIPALFLLSGCVFGGKRTARKMPGGRRTLRSEPKQKACGRAR
ncbi:MAG: alanine/glycine:cation symporter family protein [Hominenteromicrobium sp.]